MDSIGISVIVPIYRVGQYIEKCLQSIIDQNYRNIEIICVYREYPGDDSAGIIKEFQRKDDRIILLEQRSKGLSGARNEGVQIASGKYIYFVDSDDWLEPEALQTIYNCMEQDALDLLCFDAKVKFETVELEARFSEAWTYLNKKHEYKDIETGKSLFVKMTQYNEFAMVVWLNAFRREWLKDEKILFIENICHEDNPYTIECFLKAKRVRYENKKLYNYRVREDSLLHAAEIKWELYSRVVVYQKLLYWAYLEKQIEVREQLFGYARVFIDSIMTQDEELTKEKRDNWVIEDSFMDLVFKGMQIGKYQADAYDKTLYIDGWNMKLEKAHRIILYGAGAMGRLVYEYLKSHDWHKKVVAYAVTERKNAKDSLQEKSVLSIKEVAENYSNDETLIIVSVDLPLSQEMYKNCRNLNLKNVIRLDRALIHHMRYELEG